MRTLWATKLLQNYESRKRFRRKIRYLYKINCNFASKLGILWHNTTS